MSLGALRNWICRWLVVGVILHSAPMISAADPEDQDGQPAADAKAADQPAGEGSPFSPEGEADVDGESNQAQPAVRVVAPAFQFGGGFRRFFGRIGGFAQPMAVEAADEQEGAPRSVVLPDNGDMRRRLEKIKSQIADQRFGEAARHLGNLLQNDDVRDFFLTQGDGRRDSRSFHAEIRRLIGGLPPEGRAAYLAQFEAAATQQLNRAIDTGEESSLRGVVRRFPLTSAAREALYRLGHFHWDHGRPDAAATCLARLRGDSAAAESFEPALSRLLDACQVRASQMATSGSGPDDWTTYRGDPQRNRAVAGRPPLLAARWTREVAADPLTQRAIDLAARAYRAGQGVRIPMLHPLAIGDLILMRTAQGVAAFDHSTGNRLWSHPSDDDAGNAGVEQRLWTESAGGALAADDECVYLVESPPAGDGLNVLTALEHFQARQGRLRWRVGGADGGGAPTLAGMTFLGPPLVWQGRLFAEVEGKGAIALVVLDPRTGRLEWTVELALVEQPLRNDPFRQRIGAAPSIAGDELIVCPTAGGAVVAVDLTTQSLRWAYRYARRAPSAIAGIGANEGGVEFSELGQENRWLDGTIAIGRDCAVLTPPESSELQCLDRGDGKLRWAQPRGDGLFVACLTDRVVVVIGKSGIQGWNLADGQRAWSTPLPPSAYACGRGLWTGASYHLPVTSGGIIEFELAQGNIIGENRSIREIAPGNLIWRRGYWISQGPDYLQAFDERDSVLRQVRESLAASPRDAEALLRRGDLELSAGRHDEALATFREAHAAAASPKTRSRLTSALLGAARLNGPDAATYLGELDRLAEEK